jgi:hypothetical protein
VTATLPGYSTDQTLPDPAGAQIAAQPNPNILVQQITNLSLSIDRTSTLYVHVMDTSGAPMASRAITVRGSKKTKLNPDVYKYSLASTTDTNGDIALSGMEWDSYVFTPPSGFTLVSAQPYAPAPLGANTSMTVNLVLSSSGSYPTIATATPQTAQTGTSAVSLKLTGTNLSSSTTITLRKSGSADIVATSVASANTNKTLTGNLNLTGAATGAWDIVVTSGSNVATQVGGFNVVP